LNVLQLNASEAVWSWVERPKLIRKFDRGIVLLVHADYFFSRVLHEYEELELIARNLRDLSFPRKRSALITFKAEGTTK
jgi:hypothetical protein